MDFFQSAFDFTIKNEGGFVDNPADSGGPTNMGITLADLSFWRKKACSRDDIKNLTQVEAENIYHAMYWLAENCDKITLQAPAIAIFDAAVLFGPGTSAFAAQRAVRSYGVSIDLDGHIGPDTASAINALEPDRFVAAFTAELEKRISSVIAKNPKNQVFQKGWEARIKTYATLV